MAKQDRLREQLVESKKKVEVAEVEVKERDKRIVELEGQVEELWVEQKNKFDELAEEVTSTKDNLALWVRDFTA